MAAKKSESVNIRKYKGKRELNIGIFLFVIVLFYLIVTLVLYLSEDTPSVYEVREGSIVKDTSYTGLIIRDEQDIKSEGSGYIYYYFNDNSKIKAGANVYALVPSRLETGSSDSAKASTSVNSEVQTSITHRIENFNDSFTEMDFSTVYSLKDEINTYLQSNVSETKMQQLDTVIAASGQSVSSYPSSADGIMTFSTDGMEELTKDTFTAEDFDRTEYSQKELTDQVKVKKGDSIYRLITSENWSVIVLLEEETAKKIQDEEITSIQVRIDKDSQKMVADLSVIEKDGAYYGCLDFDNSMIRYADERYLNIELIFEDESGLKIPKSAVVEKPYYEIPSTCITTGANSTSAGVIVVDKNGNGKFTILENYYLDEDKGTAYISQEEFPQGTVLIQPDSEERLTLTETTGIKGVYNVNKGYAVFKRVTILCESDEYYIVKESEKGGLSNYDHINQNGTSVHSEEVVFQ